MCYQHHSYSDAKTQHCDSYCEEINSVLAETRTGWQLEQMPSANTWIKGMGQVASRPQPHLDPFSVCLGGEAGEQRNKSFRLLLEADLLPCLDPPLSLSCGLHLSLFSHGNTVFKDISIVAMTSLPACFSHLQLGSFWLSGKSQGHSCVFGRFVLLLLAGSLSKQQEKMSGRKKQ